MMRFLRQVPDEGVENFYERVKLALTWRLCIACFIVLFPVSVITYIHGYAYFLHYASVLVLLLIGILFIKIRKRYRGVSIAVSLSATTAIAASLYFVDGAFHIIEMMWMIVVALFSFFTLGRIWGIFYLVMNGVIYVIYFNTRLLLDFTHNPAFKGVMHQVMSFEFVMALTLIGYIMLQFYNVNKYSEQEKIAAIDRLNQKQYILDQKNKEKKALLQEIHHRVKNNLQVIISLLRMQSVELKSEEAIQSFDEAISRIMTMSLIHQKMYEKDSLAKLDLEDYLTTLIGDILASNTTNNEVVFKSDINQKVIGAKTIVPLGLIVNELVTNSLKHAFKARGGEITLQIDPIEELKFNLHYSDNGTWVDPENGSFGLQLIDIFVEQLEGKMEREIDDKGTHYYFNLNCLDKLS